MSFVVDRIDRVWTKKDGTKIKVSDMTENHAKNCLRLLMMRIDEHNAKQVKIHERPYSHEEVFDLLMMRHGAQEDWGDR